MRKAAGIYKIDDEYKIHSQSETVDGFYLASEPFYNLAATADKSELAEKLFSALNKSRSDLPNPKDWKAEQKSFLSAIKVKTVKHLHEKASYCLVEMDGNKVEITPYKAMGLKDGFQPLEENKIEINRDPQQSVVDAVIALLK
jgi:hypothetical protein